MSFTADPIDAHVHFFDMAHLTKAAGRQPYTLPAPHPLRTYLDGLIEAGRRPARLNNVHLSILPDSRNVFDSFETLDALQKDDPGRYGGISLAGTIVADPAYATAERLAHPQVCGIRIVLHDADLDAVSGDAFATPEWRALFARLRTGQHVHVYAKKPEVNLAVMRRIPSGTPLVVDHLGTCHSERGASDPHFAALVAEAGRRGGVCFKGPGYRTDTDPLVAADFAERIVDALGPAGLLLEATDAPHVGADPQGRPFGALFTPEATLRYVETLADEVAWRTGNDAAALLRGAAGRFLHPSSN